ncbi:MAG: alpha/beta hydrolase [Oscillospiraceae bacterium]|nr:alpha/beta hydrolase [Oscillospiraceae bacterium]
MIKKWTVTMPTPTGPHRRRAYVYLPTTYKTQPDRRYPVLYMFDGHNVFFDADATYGTSWKLGEYLDYSETQIIVAAVECDRTPTNGRLSEYSPYDFWAPEFGSVKGRGRQTMEWFVRGFKPVIDRHFRTLRGRENTFIAGSSMGGLMSLYAVTAYNKVFSRAAALSPSLFVQPRRLENLVRGAALNPDTHVYMDYGEREFDSWGEGRSRERFGRMSQALLDRRVLLTTRIVPDGDHSEASWDKQAPYFIGALTYGREDIDP